MAKKRNSQANQHNAPVEPVVDSVKSGAETLPSTDSEAMEKLESLKSLNQMLLKETFERRQQAESLFQASRSLESEVARSNSEKEALKSELTRMSEKAASLELEKSVVDVFVAVQSGLKGQEFEQKMKGFEMENGEMKLGISEKESEIGRLNLKVSEMEAELENERQATIGVCHEREYYRGKLEQRNEERKFLRQRLFEFENIKQEIDELRASYNAAMGEKEDVEMRLKSLMGEKEDMEMRLKSLMGEKEDVERANTLIIERLREQLSGIVKEKEGVEEEKKVERIKNQELENALSGIKETVADLQKEEAKLRTTVAEFEKKLAEGEGRQKDMAREIDELVEGRKFDKWVTQCLSDEKTEVENELSESLKEVDEQKARIQELDDEKNGIIGELQKEVGELKGVVLKLEEGNRVEIEKILSSHSEDRKFDKWVIQCLSDEKHVIGNELNESLKEVDEQKARIQELDDEKNGTIGELQKEVDELKGVVLKLEEGNRVELEKLLSSHSEDRKFDKWVIQCLSDEKHVIGNELNESLKEVDEQKARIQELADEKNGIIGELQREVGELNSVVLKLEEGNRVGLEKILSLQSEVGELEQANVEKERCLNAEIEKVARLKEKTMELESKIGESSKMLEQVKAERHKLLDEKKETERQCELLKMEIASLEKAINEGREECKSMKEKVELANVKSELVLKMVKGTVAFCSKDESEEEDGEFAGDEMKEYAKELETIKKAFKSKYGKVEEMKKELEGFEKNAKKKRFWAMVSSVTTLLAAVSVAYVARGGGH